MAAVPGQLFTFTFTRTQLIHLYSLLPLLAGSHFKGMGKSRERAMERKREREREKEATEIPHGHLTPQGAAAAAAAVLCV